MTCLYRNESRDNAATAGLSALTEAKEAILAARARAKAKLPDGFNIGVNIDETAGQTIPHLHVHLIPRYKDDVQDPKGRVRNVIPAKGNYLLERDRDNPPDRVADRPITHANALAAGGRETPSAGIWENTWCPFQPQFVGTQSGSTS